MSMIIDPPRLTPPNAAARAGRETMTNEIYVVMGSTGEYSDRNEWPVVAYPDETLAQQHVELASRRAKEIFASVPDGRYWDSKEKNEYDPDMSMDYTGTSYYLYKVPFSLALRSTPSDDAGRGGG